MTKKLLFLNGLAIIFVSLHHATAYGLQAMFYWTDRYLPVTVPNFDQFGSFPYQATMALRQINSLAVPAFLFVSGYFVAFMARGETKTFTWKMVVPRIKVLALPFVVWTILRYVLLTRFPTSLDEVLSVYAFVPLLIQFYLVSPILVPLAKRNGKTVILIAAALHLGVQTLRYLNGLGIEFPGQAQVLSVTPYWFFLGQQQLWFPLGLVVGLHLQEFKEWANRYRIGFLIATVVLGVVSILEFQVIENLNGEQMLGPAFAGMTRTFFILAFLLWFMTIDEKALPFPNGLSTLSARSLGIYLGNIPAIYVVAVFMYRFTPLLLGNQFFYQGILFTVGIAIPLLLMEGVRRSPARRWYRYIFG